MVTNRPEIVDNRSEKVREICHDNINNGCRHSCPLAKPCATKPGDTKEAFDNRMNEAAEEISNG